MQVVNKNGDVFGAGLQINGPDGKPKTISGGGSPTGPAGGDLSGSYPNPGVDWNLGISTYNMYYYPLTNPNGYISGITSSDVTTSLGYTPYDSSNPAGYIDSSALTPYLTSAAAASTYQPTLISSTNIKTINGASVLGSGDLIVTGSGASWGSITGTLSSQTDLDTALNGKQATLVSGTNIKTLNGGTLLGSGNISIASNFAQILTVAHVLNHTGSTANTIVHSHTASNFNANTMYQFNGILNKTAGTTGFTLRLYLNSSASLTGAILLATSASMTATNSVAEFICSVANISGTQIAVYNPSAAAFQRYSVGVGSVITRPLSYNTFIWVLQLATATDSGSLYSSRLLFYA